mgnify:CR=1 FL=1
MRSTHSPYAVSSRIFTLVLHEQQAAAHGGFQSRRQSTESEEKRAVSRVCYSNMPPRRRLDSPHGRSAPQPTGA